MSAAPHDGARGDKRKTYETAGDVEALADWLGAQLESHNVTDPSDEQTTWIEIEVEDLAERIATSDWLAADRAAAERRGAEKALREAADLLGTVEDACGVKRSCHLADQITLRERANQIGGGDRV